MKPQHPCIPQHTLHLGPRVKHHVHGTRRSPACSPCSISFSATSTATATTTARQESRRYASCTHTWLLCGGRRGRCCCRRCCCGCRRLPLSHGRLPCLLLFLQLVVFVYCFLQRVEERRQDLHANTAAVTCGQSPLIAITSQHEHLDHTPHCRAQSKDVPVVRLAQQAYASESRG